MTDNRTTELLPCPICGGQPDFQHFNITPNVQGRIVCACGIELRQGKNDTEDDMRIIWNTRSDYAVQAANERNAEQAVAATLGGEYKRGYEDGLHANTKAAFTAAKQAIAERTCEWVLEHSGTLYDKWRCSKCDYLFVEPRCDQGYTDLVPNFCPNCGARIEVGE